MSASRTLLREPAGLVYHGVAVVYAIVAYIIGIIGLFSSSWILNAGGVLLLAHAMTIAAYLVHECAHNTIFRRVQHNAALGRALCWLCGAAYGTYEDIRYKHFRHHVDNDDVVWFDYDAFFARHRILTRVVKALEWFYIPAHELIMHFVMTFTSFIIRQRRDQRLRNIVVIVIRGGVYFALLLLYPQAAVLYAMAYLLMLQALRFMDMLQHDYPYTTSLFDYREALHKGDRDWEQQHTFSNPLSTKYEKLNWLVLNFGFHSAHHADMTQPWYRLPEQHRRLFGDDETRVIPFRSQLKLFHRNRMRRVHNEQATDYPQGEAYLQCARSGVGAIGGNAASFLTSF